MSSWLDVKYINLISNQLRNFKRKSNNVYNFSCPFCGDSERNTLKARGFVYNKSGSYIYFCHNCGKGSNIQNLIKHVNSFLYEEYTKESIIEKYGTRNASPTEILNSKMRVPNHVRNSKLSELKKISQLHHDHPAKRYIESRRVPSDLHYRIFYCDRFKEWTNSIVPNKFSDTRNDEPRIIFPLLSKEKTFFGYNGRSLNTNSEMRYITIIIDDNHSKLFGMETIDYDKNIYVFEGPFDSLFVKNSVAVCGGDLYTVTREFEINRIVLVYDNEPRSPHTCRRIQKAINLGHKVFVWPRSIQQKDINELIIDGYDSNYIKRMIDSNTFRDMEAQLNFNSWSMVDA